MRALALALMLSALTASSAASGPWPRAPGSAFAALTTGIDTLSTGRSLVGEAYVELDLRARFVLGANLRHARYPDRLWWESPRESRGDLFARWHPDLFERTAVGLTFGLRWQAGEARRVAPLIAAHLGRGVDTSLGNIWARLDLQAVGGGRNLRRLGALQLSGQLGLRTGWGGLAMLTVSDHRAGGTRTLKLTPSLGYALTRRSTVVVGATVLPRSRRVDGAQLSIWYDY